MASRGPKVWVSAVSVCGVGKWRRSLEPGLLLQCVPNKKIPDSLKRVKRMPKLLTADLRVSPGCILLSGLGRNETIPFSVHPTLPALLWEAFLSAAKTGYDSPQKEVTTRVGVKI